MRISRIGVAAIASLGLLLGACSSVEPGSAGSIPSKSVPAGDSRAPTGSTNSDVPANGSAPPVHDPVDASAATADACGVLTPAQLDALGLTEGTPRQSAAGPSCYWDFAAEDANRIDFAIVEGNSNGLSDIYDQRAEYAYFEETEVGGHPAVYASEADHRDSGVCWMYVGLNDSVAMAVGSQFLAGPDQSDPCPVVARAAESMIETLKG
ncbi:Protein of unknown function [Amycolatopsis marina]|uniref:DUF3558 domain-containing protein n=1 Tax=Amycolatopsis marina TaxID=490629 RepID=A0A1I0VW36_9PSEU|nr:DUF3558 domain-containing protein [Amycolatopsis marina]SFA80408.1 Protein of unknown function [Amycolatopsis marina]